MAGKNKLLTVLSEAEQHALYGFPDFDSAQFSTTFHTSLQYSSEFFFNTRTFQSSA
jgi:hypothetical protein